MKTVAIDTSLPSGSVAALDGERMSEVCFAPAQAHARRIAAALAEATAALGWDLGVVGKGTYMWVGASSMGGVGWGASEPLCMDCSDHRRIFISHGVA